MQDGSTDKEFKHFFGVANGSVFELQTQLLLANNLSLIRMMEFDPLIDICTELQKMIYSFQNNLNNKIEQLNQLHILNILISQYLNLKVNENSIYHKRIQNSSW